MCYSVKKVCIPLAEILCLSEMVKNGRRMFLERRKLPRDAGMSKCIGIMLNIHANVVLFSNEYSFKKLNRIMVLLPQIS